MELFEPIRAAVGLPKGDPRYETQVRELIEAMGELAVPSSAESSSNAEIAAPARFPSLSAGRAEPRGDEPALAIRELPKRTAPPAPGGIPELRSEIEGYLRLGRRLGVGASELNDRARELERSEEAAELDRFATELFVRAAASLTDTYAALLNRRNELAELLPTPQIDGGLEAGRTDLALGDLERTEISLREAGAGLDRLEEEWGPSQVLLQGAVDLEDTIRDLGGDPGPAHGPILEGRRLIHSLERGRAESVLARGTVGLWTVLNPLLERDLTRRISEVRTRKEAGSDVEPVLSDLTEFASQVRQRNFSAAVAFYRRGVDRLSRLAPPSDGPAPSLNIDPSVPSS
jgi:hypothetical protein